jgi:hypothetical protein
LNGRKILSWVCLVIGLLGTVYGAVDCYWNVKLSKSTKTADATVTEKAIHYSDGKDHVIRFSFTVGSASYSASDVLGRVNLWTTLPKARWDAIKINDVVLVRYCADRPSVNKLAEKNTGVSDSIVWMMSAFVFLGIGLVDIRTSGRSARSP